MRILVTTNAAVGHFYPLVPTVEAFAAAGHEVRVGCPGSFAATVARAGSEPLGCAERTVEVPIPPHPLIEDRAAMLSWAVMLGWPFDARSWVDDLLRQAAVWQPQLVIVEPVEHAGRVIAAALGIPVVEHGWGFTLPAGMSDAGSFHLADIYAAVGARPTPPVWRVDLGIQSLQSSDAPRVPRYRYVPYAQPGDALPDRDERPRVLITLGTYPNPAARQRLRRIAAEVCDSGAQVVIALANSDRGSAGDFPPESIVRDWIDLPTVIRTCDLVIHHGGAGTSWAVLAAGRPAVVIPQAGDQFRNSELLTRAGVALVIDPADLDRTSIRRAIEQLLFVPGPAERAAYVARQNAALPDLQKLTSDLATCLAR